MGRISCTIVFLSLLLASSRPASASMKASTTHHMEYKIELVPGKQCPPLSKDLLTQHAKDKMVLIMAVDKLLMQRFGRSWIQAVQKSGITYWYIAAMDPWTSEALGSLNVTQCFNAPYEELGYKGAGKAYQWGSDHWHQTTWNKVFIIRAVYRMGFHVLHSDADTTWWNDPHQWLTQFTKDEAPPHALFTTDSLETRNDPADQGLEASTSPWYNINTGVYFIKQYPHGEQFFKDWLYWFPKKIGHDQDGLNNVVRGMYRTGDKTLPTPEYSNSERIIWAATSNKTAVSLLAVSGWGNAYTYITGRVHKLYNSTLYETHWVWTGGSPECKVQNMRDAMTYMDSPEYYGHTPAPPLIPVAAPGVVPTPQHAPKPLMLLTMDLDVPQVDASYNKLQFNDTEFMVQTHIHAANYQLQQAYWGILATVALDRVFMLPGFQCFCAKNWYMTQSCRINGEKHTRFPFMCALSDLLRAKKILTGMQFVFSSSRTHELHVREYPFLSNPHVAADLKASKLVLQPMATGNTGTVPVTKTQLSGLEAPARQADGTHSLDVPWPLNSEQLKQVVDQAAGGPWRIVHLSNASRIMGGGFKESSDWAAFDGKINTYVTYWCCRSPADQKALKGSDRIQFQMLPPARLSLKPISTASS